MWYNRNTGSAYLGLPTLATGGTLDFGIEKVTNPWPFQKAAWGTNPLTLMTAYQGHVGNVLNDPSDDQAHRQSHNADLSWNTNHNYPSYKKEVNRITIDTALSYSTDTYPGLKVVMNQNYYIKFHLINLLLNSDLQYRQFNMLRF